MIKVSLLCRKTRALAPTQYLKESLSLGVIIERIMGNSNVPKTNKHNLHTKGTPGDDPQLTVSL